MSSVYLHRERSSQLISSSEAQFLGSRPQTVSVYEDGGEKNTDKLQQANILVKWGNHNVIYILVKWGNGNVLLFGSRKQLSLL